MDIWNRAMIQPAPMVGSNGLIQTPSDELWLTSREHPEWGSPRPVRWLGLVPGPSKGRQYAWLELGPPLRPDLASEARYVVICPRHAGETLVPLKDPGVDVHLWRISDADDLEDGFRPPSPIRSLAWCILCTSLSDAQTLAAKTW